MRKLGPPELDPIKIALGVPFGTSFWHLFGTFLEPLGTLLASFGALWESLGSIFGSVGRLVSHLGAFGATFDASGDFWGAFLRFLVGCWCLGVLFSSLFVGFGFKNSDSVRYCRQK